MKVNILNFFNKVKCLLNLHANLITICLLFLVSYFEIYRLIFSILIFRLLPYFKEIPYVKNKLKIFDQDRITIKIHWNEDKDLIKLTRFCRFLYLISFCCFFSFFLYLSSYYKINYLDVVNGMLEGNPILVSEKIMLLPYLSLILIILALTLSLVGEFHIIMFRNTSTIFKYAQIVLGSGKYIGVVVVATVVPTTLLLEVVTNTPLIKPTKLGNFYQQYYFLGRGYGFNSTSDMMLDDALKSCSKYELTKLISPITGNFSVPLAKLFIEENKDLIIKECNMMTCNICGLKKGSIL